MASTSRITLRKDCEVSLIGNFSSQIIGSKLPSKRQMLKVLFYNLRVVNLNLQDSARLTIREATVFWEKARIPIQSEKNSIPKLKRLYDEWRSIQKCSSRPVEKKSSAQIEKENKFIRELDDIFDFAAENALTIMKNKDDIEFLKLQREKGRPGYMHGIDKTVIEHEEKIFQRAEKAENYKKRKAQELEELCEKVELADSSEEEVCSIDMEKDERSDIEIGEVVSRISRGSQQIITERLVSALDKCKLSDREAMHLISAVADALGHDLNHLVLNRTSLQRVRRDLRQKKAEKIKKDFNNTNLNAAVIHWDGKLLPSITGHETVDRLPIIITNGDIEQILHIPSLENGTGKMQAEAVFNVLCDWGLESTVKACCFDTTATNTGAQNGACVLLEGLLERRLLYLPCRHHISELLLRAVFECKITGTSGPNNPLFKRFQDAWPNIDQKKFLPGINEEYVAQIFNGDKFLIIEYLKTLKEFTRNDYKEFANLCMIFLGELPKENVNFHYPGAMHHARWMSKSIYSLKIYLFRNEFNMKAATKKALRDVCIFIVKIYVKYWFLSPHSTKAPLSDFNLIKNLSEYQKIDKIISDTALAKFLNHLWYLSPETVALSLFDDDVSLEIKEKMRENINNVNESEEEMIIPSKRITFKHSEIGEILKKELDQFVGPQTKIFFEKFDMNYSFLSKPASEWETDEQYQNAKKISEKIKVVNDAAERGVKLIEEYNKKLSTDEDQKQYIIQVVSNYRKKFPDCRKKTLVLE